MPMLKHINSHTIAISAFLLTCGCGSSNEFIAPPPPTVTVQPPVEKDVTTHNIFTGRTDAVELVEIRARVPGFLESIKFSPASLVEKDQILFVIEKGPYQAKLSASQADLSAAKAQFTLSNEIFTRVSALSQDGNRVVSEKELIEATANRDTAAAGISSAEAAVMAAQIDLDYTIIRAPISGRIDRTLVTEGNLVGTGEPTLLTTIVTVDPMFVYFDANERMLIEYLRKNPHRENKTQEDQGSNSQFTIELADGNLYASKGTVDYFSNQLDRDTGTIELRGTIPNPQGVLVPGLFVRVLIPQTTEQALLVPRMALQQDIVGSFLLTLDQNDQVQRKDVKMGQVDGQLQVVTEGITKDDRIIVLGVQKVQPGMKATVDSNTE